MPLILPMKNSAKNTNYCKIGLDRMKLVPVFCTLVVLLHYSGSSNRADSDCAILFLLTNIRSYSINSAIFLKIQSVTGNQ